MFKNHPKGLLAASLANMGERFGFYTMMAILVLFLQAKFGLSGSNAGIIYAIFYASIYLLALVGGLIADKTRKYKGTILAGLITMALGYLFVSIPTPTPVPSMTLYLAITCFGLLVIAFGNGLFKGNLQALVGQMYDNEKYQPMRDSGFSLFYMFINVGAIFAPFAASGVRNWWLSSKGFAYNSDLPAACHQYLSGTITPEGSAHLTKMATEADMTGAFSGNMAGFVNSYLDAFATGFHYAFAVAIFAMLISTVVYVMNKKNFPNPKKVLKKGEVRTEEHASDAVVLSTEEIKQRMLALFAVFGVVIFFWFSFHQNGLTLTFFAKEYTLLKIGSMNITAEMFQAANPFFVVFLTPLIMWLFGWLRSRNMEPSTPKKIAIGMFIAALAYVLMAFGSFGLPLHNEVAAMGGLPEAQKVTPYLLLGTYFIITIAELFISPLGISFVSKVAPPQYQGVMQGGWLGATALGNQLLFIGAIFYESIPIWATWSIFIVACLISMTMMLTMLRWLEKIAK
ncbi:MAG: symporter [Ignavibacteria bacterium GWF2_33_9]|nr:MAG: symporter [Ignavibacteria bacterium GWF2_33_9]